MKEKKTAREIQLEGIIADIIWMARRYADGRSTYAPGMYNEAAQLAMDLGVEWKHDKNGEVWASDGSFGAWDPVNKRFRGKIKDEG